MRGRVCFINGAYLLSLFRKPLGPEEGDKGGEKPSMLAESGGTFPFTLHSFLK